MIHVYVAASAAPSESLRVQAAIAALEQIGCKVTSTWPGVVASTPGGSNPRDATWFDRIRWSRQDLLEVADSDIVWCLVPEAPLTTRGAWFEAGYAHGLGKVLLFSGDTRQSVFCALGSEYASDLEAASRIRFLAGKAA